MDSKQKPWSDFFPLLFFSNYEIDSLKCLNFWRVKSGSLVTIQSPTGSFDSLNFNLDKSLPHGTLLYSINQFQQTCKLKWINRGLLTHKVLVLICIAVGKKWGRLKSYNCEPPLWYQPRTKLNYQLRVGIPILSRSISSSSFLLQKVNQCLWIPW